MSSNNMRIFIMIWILHKGRKYSAFGIPHDAADPVGFAF